MKTTTSLFNRSMLALSLGAALASLPVSVRAQNVRSQEGAMPNATASPNEASSTGAPAHMQQPTAPPKEAVTDDKLALSDKVLIRKFANINEAEVEMAKLAATNGESQAVKDYAAKMVEVHDASNAELREVATAHGMGDKPQLDAEAKANYAKLKQLHGKNFDSAYLNHAVADHESAAKDLTKAQKGAKDEKLLAYVNKTLPVVEEHLKMAKELKMGGAKSMDMKGEKAAEKKASM